MKPVNLTQLRSQTKSDCLSFFYAPISISSCPTDLESFLDGIKDLLSDKPRLLKIFEKDLNQIKKILKSHPDRTHGFFLSTKLQGYVILDQKLESYSILGESFHVRPLLEELFVNPEFMLINVSLYDIKIFKGDFLHLEVIDQYEFDHLPTNFNENSSRLYAPQYLGLIPYKTILALKIIAQKIKDLILYQSIPVIVTGLDEMKTIFLRYFNESVGVITHIQEDFYEKTCVEIIARCKSFRYIVMDYYSAQFKERLKRLIKSKKIISDLDEIIKESFDGNVVHLVIPPQQKIWGKIDLATKSFVIHKKVTKTSIDILDELAKEVIKHGGKIQILGAHFFPADTNILGILKGSL